MEKATKQLLQSEENFAFSITHWRWQKSGSTTLVAWIKHFRAQRCTVPRSVVCVTHARASSAGFWHDEAPTMASDEAITRGRIIQNVI